MKHEKITSSMFTFVSISCSVSFVLFLAAKKLYIYNSEKKSSKSSMNRKRFFTFYTKSFLCLTSLFSHNKEEKKNKYNLIYSVFEASFHARICHQKLFYAFVTLEALKLRRNEIFLLSHSISSALLYIIKMRGYEPIITFNI